MSSTSITDIFAWEAFDSRGKPTVACTVTTAGGGSGRATVPSGASTGGHEARELRDGGERYGGDGVAGAVHSVNSLVREVLTGVDADDQGEVDRLLETLDAEPDFRSIGSNAVLAASLATLQAAADTRGRPLWQHLGGGSPLLPLPMVNIVSGGAHARGLLDIQDVLVVPHGATSFAQAIEWAWRVRRSTAELLDERGGSSALVADEGGLSGALGSNRAALALVADGIARAGLEPGEDASLAVDLAANQLFDGTTYRLAVEDLELTPDQWIDTVTSWCAEFPIVSIEDLLAEDDWVAWRRASQLHNGSRQLIGDDLFATSLARLDRGVESGVANSVLVKPNQAGTVSRARSVLDRAHQAGYTTVVSARSGDTEDSWLSDLAVGWGAGQVKVGSTTRSERTSKWNRLLEIEARAGATAQFAGGDALGGIR